MKELPTSYSPQLVEDKWTYFWERKGFLHADALSEKKPFCLLLPPPNVTG
ncbi:MAG: hypothetical protein HYZ47_05120, partial [Simkania negevensis]|nr:hypothetical protein [Simkania negevensis]